MVFIGTFIGTVQDVFVREMNATESEEKDG